MKQWKKTVCIVIAMIAICVAVVFSFRKETECCLCNAPTSSVRCLIDLETGAILELSLDGPSTTPGPGGQTDVATFSFIRFGSVTGTKQTAPNVIELKIPADDTVNTPALCNKCRKLVPGGYVNRYLLADLNNGVLYPVTAKLDLSICGYQIQITHAKDQMHIVIR